MSPEGDGGRGLRCLHLRRSLRGWRLMSILLTDEVLRRLRDERPRVSPAMTENQERQFLKILDRFSVEGHDPFQHLSPESLEDVVTQRHAVIDAYYPKAATRGQRYSNQWVFDLREEYARGNGTVADFARKWGEPYARVYCLLHGRTYRKAGGPILIEASESRQNAQK